MATYSWSVPVGKEITGATYIKDTDNNISDTISDLVEFVNGEGAHAGQGLTFDMVDKVSIQTITGAKTFSAVLVASGGINGTNGVFTGQVKGITPIDAEDLARKDYVDGIVTSTDDGSGYTYRNATKLADGTMICTGIELTASGTSAETFIFKEAFLVSPIITTQIELRSGSAVRILQVLNKSNTLFQVYKQDSNGVNILDEAYVHYIAIGRWK